MDDDFNTPLALAELKGLTRALNAANAKGDAMKAEVLAAELLAMGKTFGLLGHDAAEWLRKPKAAQTSAVVGALSDDEVDEMICRRNAARQRKDFHEADQIRERLMRAGVLLEDAPGGNTSWRRN